MLTNLFTNIVQIPAGATQINQVFSNPVNGNLNLIPSSKNCFVKKIFSFIHIQRSPSGIPNTVLTNYTARFQGLNRDGSIMANNAGNIINPISGAWGNAFIKDSIYDFMITSKKSQIEFDEKLNMGGIRAMSCSVQISNPETVNINAFLYISIEYQENE